MQNYYFHVTGAVDQEGTPLPSPSVARQEGIKLLGSLLLYEEWKFPYLPTGWREATGAGAIAARYNEVLRGLSKADSLSA